MGVLAALGMKGRQVMSLFLLEGAMIGAVGAAVGCTLGWLAMLAFNLPEAMICRPLPAQAKFMP